MRVLEPFEACCKSKLDVLSWQTRRVKLTNFPCQVYKSGVSRVKTKY